jgi:hypothetical protein
MTNNNLEKLPKLTKDFPSLENYQNYLLNIKKKSKEKRKTIQTYRDEIFNFFNEKLKDEIDILFYPDKIKISLNAKKYSIDSEILIYNDLKYIFSIDLKKNEDINILNNFLEDTTSFKNTLIDNKDYFLKHFNYLTLLVKNIIDIEKKLLHKEKIIHLINNKNNLSVIEKILVPLGNKNKINNKEELFLFIKNNFPSNMNDKGKEEHFLEMILYDLKETDINFYDEKVIIKNINTEYPSFFCFNKKININTLIDFLNNNVFFFNNKIVNDIDTLPFKLNKLNKLNLVLFEDSKCNGIDIEELSTILKPMTIKKNIDNF